MKRTAFLLPCIYLLLCAALVTVVAAGGDSSDPLASLSYLNGTFAATVDAKVDAKLDASDQAILTASGSTSTVSATAGTWRETRLKQRDVLSGGTGLNVTVLAGSVQVTFSSGTVVDVTDGTTVTSGKTLTVNHRYLVAEDTTASFIVASATAVVDYMGPYTFAYSDALDFNAMASALKTLHLFKGSNTGYGSGFDLEVAPTRLQSLIMFIRVLGEEDAALAYTGTTPFTDIVKGTDAAKYVGYAYSKGYTNGYTPTTWKPAQRVNVSQYTEFLLRALGYSSASNTNLSSTLENAQNCGVLTAGEITMLKSTTFLRAHLVYESLYALDANVAGTSSTLRETLIGKGAFTSAEAASASALVTSARIA